MSGTVLSVKLTGFGIICLPSSKVSTSSRLKNQRMTGYDVWIDPKRVLFDGQEFARDSLLRSQLPLVNRISDYGLWTLQAITSRFLGGEFILWKTRNTQSKLMCRVYWMPMSSCIKKLGGQLIQSEMQCGEPHRSERAYPSPCRASRSFSKNFR